MMLDWISRRELLRYGAGLLPALPLLAQDPATPPKFSSDVSVVNVLVTVRDHEGKIVGDLTKDDFELTEDGRPETIQYFTQQFDSPLTLGLLVDTSGSERRNIDSERRASYQFFDHVLREDRDKAFLIHFDWQVELVKDLTSSRTQLDKGLDTLAGDQPARGQGQGQGRGRGGSGGTTLYDAIFLASDEVLSKQKGRKAIILFSDGEDNGSKETLNSAIEAAQRADTLVYAIRFAGEEGFRPAFGGGGRGRRGRGFPGGGGYPGGGNPGGGRNRTDGKRVLQQISEETGGAYFEAGSGSSLDKIYARIEDELRNQYNLGYTSDQHGAGYRKIQVTTKRKSLKVQARDGYYAG